MAYENAIIRGLHKIFRWHASRLSRYPLIYILIPVILAAGSVYGLTIWRHRLTLDFKTLGGRSSEHFRNAAISKKLWSSEKSMMPEDLQHHPAVLITRKDDGSILNAEALSFTVDLNRRILNLESTETNSSKTGYEVLCRRVSGRCFKNEHIYMFQKSLTRDEITVGFPITETPLMPVYVGEAIGGVGRNVNGSVSSVKAIGLFYPLNLTGSSISEVDKWVSAFHESCGAAGHHNSYDVQCFSGQTLKEGLSLSASIVAQRLPICAVLVAVLLVVFIPSQCSDASVMKALVTKITMIWVVVITAVISISTSFGLMFYTGLPFGPNVAVVALLGLGISIGDSMIILSAWHHTDHALSTERRLVDAMNECGVTLTFTSLATAVTFIVLCYIPLSFLRLMSVYAFVLVIICYMFQMTFFMACLVLSTWLDRIDFFRGKLAKVAPLACPAQNSEDVPNTRPHLNAEKSGATGSDKIQPSDHCKADYCKVDRCKAEFCKADHYRAYGSLITSTGTIIVAAIFLTYIAGCAYGVTRLQPDLNLGSFFPRSFYGTKFLDTLNTHFYPEGKRAQIIVKDPGDLSNRFNRWMLLKMEQEFDNTSCSIAMHGQLFWLNAYMNEYKSPFMNLDKEIAWTKDLYGFSTLQTYRMLAQQLSFRNATPPERIQCRCPEILRSYRFSIALKNYGSMSSRSQCSHEFRALAKKYRSHGVTIIFPEGYLTDIYDQILPLTLQISAVSVITSELFGIVFLWNILSVAALFLTTLSTYFGILGFMGLFTIPLDPASLVAIFISTGVCIRNSAYALCTLCKSADGDKNRRECIFSILRSSTIPGVFGTVVLCLCLLPLLGTGVPAIDVFSKSALICAVIGAIHGCLFVPLFVQVFDLMCRFWRETHLHVLKA